jgi:hypothetical protein
LLVGTGHALAALPPQYQRQAELEQIIAAATDALGIGNVITAISMTGTDEWEVIGGQCSVKLTVVDVPRPDSEPGFAGPRNFAVQADTVRCP